MDSKLFKLTYNGALFRVKADFTLGAIQASAEPPADALAKAQAKIDAVEAAGQIAVSRTYPERFAALWERARQLGVPKGLENQIFSVTLASGAPELPGFTVTKSAVEKIICNVTFHAPRETMQTWRIEWVKLILRRELEKLGIKGMACPAMLQGVLLRAQSGEPVRDYPLAFVATGDRPPGGEEKIYSLLWNKGRREVAAIVYDVKPLFDKEQVAALLNGVTTAGQKAVQSAGVPLRVLRNEFVAGLESAKTGPEFFGLDLPLVQLAVTGVGLAQQDLAAIPAPRPTAPARSSGGPAMMPLSGPAAPGVSQVAFGKITKTSDDVAGANRAQLPILVTKDRLQAKVGDFPVANYDRFMGIDAKWLHQEIARQGVVYGVREEFIQALEDAIMQRQPLTGLWVAVGDAGVGGKEPFLKEATKDQATDSETIDMRSSQNTSIVKSGQLLASIAYQVPAIPGRDVRGEATPPPPGEDFPVTASEGVEARGGKFYATADGVPVIDPKGAISLSRSMQHNGDVNLATGNIHFDGPVEIKGSIDTGAEVFATGDIVIQGDIRGGRVRSMGSIRVTGSVTTGEAGLIKAAGTIHAEFLQNSVAMCGGDLVVKKSILSSKVTVSGGIQCLTADSMISGGRIRCIQYIKVGNLGQPKGNPTEVAVGVDGTVEDRIVRVQKRLEKVSRKNEDDRNNLRELIRKKDAQLTQRHTEMKAALQERVQRGSALIELIKKRIEVLNTQRGYNPDARIYVANRCVTNCKITMAGNTIPMLNDLAGVVILAKKWAGSYIASIEDWMAKEAKDNGGMQKAG